MKAWLKRWRLLAGVAVVAILLYVAMRATPIAVDLATVARGSLEVTIDEEGETHVRERFVVSAPVTGRLRRITLEPGDRVVRGKTVVARIDAAPPALIDARTQAELASAVEAARAAAGTARAERERAQAAVARAQSSLKRQRELSDVGAISLEELEMAQTTLRLAEEALRAADFAVARADYELQTARARLQPSGGSTTRSVELTAPVDGAVLKRLRESEAVVAAGEPLVEIGDPAAIEIVADLLSTDAVKVKEGARVLIEQWGGDHALEGRVRRVEPSGFMKVSALGVEEQRVNVRIDLTNADEARALGDGYRVEVRIVVAEEEGVLKVPIGALFRRGEQWAVFLFEGDRVRLQPVEVGARNQTEAELRQGLSEGQRVVLHPPDTLVDGSKATERTQQ
ncbi:MAG TPA: efflux RND transporter periplasmic adaptor subunit [Vicinamibacterales bacterium]|nr:efflux RND transporter periplasmic adaptor subunit [Vicinamibacterales bacterium]